MYDFGIIHTESIEMIILSMVRDDKKRRKKLSPMSIPHVTCWVLHSWLIFVFGMVYVFVFDTVYGFVFGMVYVFVLFLTSLMAGLRLMSNSHVRPFIVTLRFCIFVSVSLFLSVLVFFDKPDGGTESDVHPTCWVWDKGGVEATLPLNFVIIVI